jgi:hypothetical protein
MSAILIAATSTNYALASTKSAVTNNKQKKSAEGFLLINVDASYDAAVGIGSTNAEMHLGDLLLHDVATSPMWWMRLW